MDKRILIVHGWMESSKRYNKVKEYIESNTEYRVELFECYGFGDTTAIRSRNKTIPYSALAISDKISTNSYDYIIGFSMGTSVILRALDEVINKPKVILINPVYSGLLSLLPVILITPILPVVFICIKYISTEALRILGKPFLRLLFNNVERNTDELFYKDIRKADTLTAVSTLLYMILDDWMVSKDFSRDTEVNMIISTNDKVVTKRVIRKLKEDLKHMNEFRIKDASHMVFMENFSEVCLIICSILKGKLVT